MVWVRASVIPESAECLTSSPTQVVNLTSPVSETGAGNVKAQQWIYCDLGTSRGHSESSPMQALNFFSPRALMGQAGPADS